MYGEFRECDISQVVLMFGRVWTQKSETMPKREL